jgi:hypothetical protein
MHQPTHTTTPIHSADALCSRCDSAALLHMWFRSVEALALPIGVNKSSSSGKCSLSLTTDPPQRKQEYQVTDGLVIMGHHNMATCFCSTHACATAIIAIITVVTTVASSAQPPQPCVGNCTVAHTTRGDIEGIPARCGNKGAIHFLGVPFAAPPVGDLRWQPPQQHESWSNILPTKKCVHARHPSHDLRARV